MKRCNCCGLELPFSKFYKKLQGLQPNCKDCQKAEKRTHYAENKPTYKERQDRWVDRNRDRKYAINKRWNDSNRDTLRGLSREHYLNNPELYADKARKRRARKRELPFDNYTRLEIFERDNGRCWHCLAYAPLTPDNHIDHLVGLCNDDCPGDIRSNVAWSCGPCNLAKPKQARPEDYASHEFLKQLYEKVMI